MGFDAELGLRRTQGGAQADVEGEAMEFTMRFALGWAVEHGGGSIHAIGREGLAGAIEVGGGETERAAKAVALDDAAADGIGSPKHLACGIEVARPDGFADAGAADARAVQRTGGGAAHRTIDG